MNDIVGALLDSMESLSDAEILEKFGPAIEATKDLPFKPTPGPQSDAYFSKADLLLYGGAAGGGKSALLNGLALTQHKRSLLMRRTYTDLRGGGGLIEEILSLYGTRQGFNGSIPPLLKTEDGRIITFGAALHLGDEQSFQGRARDFLGLDEATQFMEEQVRFLMGWLRSEDPEQRVRAVLASNPPVSSDGDWVIGMFRPWLDITHNNPARAGELRYYVTDPDGRDMEVDGPDLVEFPGQDRPVKPKSRTFIPAMLADNPYLVNTDYASTLDAMPEPLRSAMRDGNFMLARKDQDNQIIPTEWVRQAQARWKPEPPEHAPMCSIGVDIAQGGDDETILSPRYDHWFAELEATPGTQTPTGREVAVLIMLCRKSGAQVVLDMGGGYGGATHLLLEENLSTDELLKHNGANKSIARTSDGTLGFVNKRAEVWWKFREALDPGQTDGSPIALPPDPKLVSDLTAPTFKLTPRGIQVESKEDLKKRLGRSPDRGDAVTMSWAAGGKILTHGREWREKRAGRAGQVVVKRAHEAVRKAARR